MVAQLFQHRSGRIVALCRAVLGVVFLVALWVDPAQPVRSAELGYLLLGMYVAVAGALLYLAFTNWWWDHRLAWWVLALDVAAFLASVYFTEGMNDDFNSPFLAFFAYLMLAATIRSDWRVTAATGLIVTALYLSIGLVLAGANIEFDMMRFGRRVVYMLVLALVLTWFVLQRRDQFVSRFFDRGDSAGSRLPPLDQSLAYALTEFGAREGVIVWSDDEEPEPVYRLSGQRADTADAATSEAVAESDLGNRIRLFSADRRRALLAAPGHRPVSTLDPSSEPLADRFAFGDTLAIPFAVAAGRGEVLLAGIIGPCADHVTMGSLVAREIEAAFDRHASLVLARETLLARARDALARDLHDSVAQSLAGAAMRVEGLRNWIRAGNDPESEIALLKDALRAEQNEVREMIARLRDPLPPAPAANLAKMLPSLSQSLSSGWNVAVDCRCAADLEVGADLGYAVAQMLREAVANSVRHGRATRVVADVTGGQRTIAIKIADDGRGFAPGTGSEAPRSIRERVERLGGTIAVKTGTDGTSLELTLPSKAPG